MCVSNVKTDKVTCCEAICLKSGGRGALKENRQKQYKREFYLKAERCIINKLFTKSGGDWREFLSVP